MKITNNYFLIDYKKRRGLYEHLNFKFDRNDGKLRLLNDDREVLALKKVLNDKYGTEIYQLDIIKGPADKQYLVLDSKEVADDVALASFKNKIKLITRSRVSFLYENENIRYNFIMSNVYKRFKKVGNAILMNREKEFGIDREYLAQLNCSNFYPKGLN